MQAITFLSTLALALAAAPSFTEAARVEVAASVRVCQPAAIQWSQAQGQVFLSVVIGTDPSVSAPGQLKQFPVQTGASGSIPWTVDVAPGTTLTFIINDSTGIPNYSSQIQVSGENTCNAGATFAASDATGGSASGSAAAGSSTGAASATRPAASSSAAASPTNSRSASVSASRSSTSGSTAPTTSAPASTGAAGSLRSFSGMAVGAGAALVGAAVALL